MFLGLAFLRGGLILTASLALGLSAHAADILSQTPNPELQPSAGMAAEFSGTIIDEGDPLDPLDNLVLDRTGRMTVDVVLNGKGPYPFIVDTGAQGTLIASELARRLTLKAGAADIKIHGMTGERPTTTVVVPTMEVSGLVLSGVEAPILTQYQLGAPGLLGLDALQSRRLLMNFKERTMVLTASSAPQEKWFAEDSITVTARKRFGQLVFTDATVDGESVDVIIDTGSDVSVGNEALRRKLLGRKAERILPKVRLISVTGGAHELDYAVVDEVSIKGIGINNLTVAFSDAHPFRILGLTRRPALLLGMEALRLFDGVSIDFGSRKVRFVYKSAKSAG